MLLPNILSAPLSPLNFAPFAINNLKYVNSLSEKSFGISLDEDQMWYLSNGLYAGSMGASFYFGAPLSAASIATQWTYTQYKKYYYLNSETTELNLTTNFVFLATNHMAQLQSLAGLPIAVLDFASELTHYFSKNETEKTAIELEKISEVENMITSGATTAMLAALDFAGMQNLGNIIKTTAGIELFFQIADSLVNLQNAEKQIAELRHAESPHHYEPRHHKDCICQPETSGDIAQLNDTEVY